MDVLRFATAGSVDDGKSTLIGRLLFDSKQIFEDQWASVEEVSRERGDGYTNLALLTDGLRAEREQGITIDVAYRYFATPKRKFIIADTPGHVQYTRNMVTGASTADLALILVDARNGIQEQSRRHVVLASLLRVPYLVLCVNKMDLVDYQQEVFERIRDDFKGFSANLPYEDLAFVPISALKGDNVVNRSENMPWYTGSSLLHLLETVHVAPDWDPNSRRFPVQYVIRPMSEQHPDYRGYAGTVAGGVFREGDDVLVLPSGMTSRVASIDLMDTHLTEAFPPMAVSMQLTDDIDVGRGSMLCHPDDQPTGSRQIDAMICWMSPDRPMRPGDRFAIKHTSRAARAIIQDISYRLDVNTLGKDAGGDELKLNELGRATLKTSAPLFWDLYERNRHTGSFILIDEATNVTVGSGMIMGDAS